MLAVKSISLICIMIWLPWSIIHIDASQRRGPTADDLRYNEKLRQEQPFAAITLLIFGIQNIIAWMGMKTMRLRWVYFISNRELTIFGSNFHQVHEN